MRKLLHIGYFKDTEDLKMFYNVSADEIINNLSKGNFQVCFGRFYTIKEKNIYNEDDLIGEKKTTSDNEYVVISDLPVDIELLDKPNVCDFYIDVYKVVNNNIFPTKN